ncbi:MAG: hypothetical protein NTY35_16875 [Planctomycetota bacterium]|nr:hypothetical protein [Planctomycetota bacterium]
MEEPAPRPPNGPEPATPKSFGNMGDHHWSRAREGSNTEALDYYRERSKAPGVAEGGGPRNMYCMHCDGVIPLGRPVDACPHCGRALEGDAKRYFNWVELDQPPRSDLRSLWPFLAAGLLAVAAIAWFVVWLFTRGGPA